MWKRPIVDETYIIITLDDLKSESRNWFFEKCLNCQTAKGQLSGGFPGGGSLNRQGLQYLYEHVYKQTDLRASLKQIMEMFKSSSRIDDVIEKDPMKLFININFIGFPSVEIVVV